MINDERLIEYQVEAIEQRLSLAGVANARGSAIALMRLATSRQQQADGSPLDALVEELVTQRVAHRSVARIIGSLQFHGVSVRLHDGVYEPCLSSERLLDHALEWADDSMKPWRILDLGTGSGNLLLAALSALPNATGVGVDCNAAAIALAHHNAVASGLASRCSLIEGDAHKLNLSGFDFVLSTLPWIPTAQLDALMPEVRLYDPIEALDGGRDGLDHVRSLAGTLDAMLSEGGCAFCQVGYERVTAAHDVFRRAGYTDTAVLRDAYSFPMGLRIGKRTRCARP